MANELATLLAERAMSFLDSLGSEQRTRATFDVADEAERRSWAYFPRDHKGLPLHDMDRAQQKRAHALLAASLSLPAYAKTNAIIGMESVLNEIEGRRIDQFRDPGRYFLSVFGAPGSDAWSFRVEGHHVSLNFTFARGEVVGVTPVFLGSNPAEVRHGDYAVVRPCGEEEDAGFEMLASLDAGQRKVATISDTAPQDFVLLNAPEVPERALPGDVGAFPPLEQALKSAPEALRQAVAFDRAVPKGLLATEMTAVQRAKLQRLVRVYVERLPDALATRNMQRIDLGVLHFTWAGAAQPGEGHYYRVQGGPFLVEYDNTQDGANHIHAVWRDVDRDFGGDALRRHLALEHAR